MVCLGRIEKKESYLGALPEQGISCLPLGLLNQNATGTETNIQVNKLHMLHLDTPELQQLEVTLCQYCVNFLDEVLVLCPKLAIVEQGDIANSWRSKYLLY